jgi:WD40 repeat protein
MRMVDVPEMGRHRTRIDPVRRWGGFEAGVSAVAVSPDGATIAAGTYGESGDIHLLDYGSDARRGALRGHRGQVRSVAYSRDGRWLASGGADGTLRIWDPLRRVEVRCIRDHDREKVNDVAFSADGAWVASCNGGGVVTVWDRESGAIVWRRDRLASILAVTFSHRGRKLAFGEEGGSVVLVDFERNEEAQLVARHFTAMLTLDFDPDDLHLAAASVGAQRVIFDVFAKRDVFLDDDPLHHGETTAIRFAPDGSRLVWVTRGGEIGYLSTRD